jgi:hypothetical protein
LTDSGNWRTATDLLELQWEANSCCRDNSGKPISAISWLAYPGRPIELDKPRILALAAETSFLLFKEQVPLKLKKEISAVQCERKTFQLISLSTPVNFRWTFPLMGLLYGTFCARFFGLYGCI